MGNSLKRKSDQNKNLGQEALAAAAVQQDLIHHIDSCDQQQWQSANKEHSSAVGVGHKPQADSEQDCIVTRKENGGHVNGEHGNLVNGEHENLVNGEHENLVNGEHENLVNGEHLDQVNSEDVNQVNSEHVNQVNSEHLNPVNREHVNQVNSEQVNQVNSEHVNQVNSEHVNPVHLVNSEHVNQVNSEHVNQVNSEHMNHVNSEDVNPVNSEHMNHVNSEHMNHVNSEDVNPVNSEHMNQVNSEDVNPVNSEHVNPVNREHVNQVNSEQVNQVNSEHVNPVNSEHVNQVNSEQVNQVNSEHVNPVNLVNSEHVKQVNSEHVNQLLVNDVSQVNMDYNIQVNYNDTYNTKQYPNPEIALMIEERNDQESSCSDAQSQSGSHSQTKNSIIHKYLRNKIIDCNLQITASKVELHSLREFVRHKMRYVQQMMSVIDRIHDSPRYAAIVQQIINDKHVKIKLGSESLIVQVADGLKLKPNSRVGVQFLQMGQLQVYTQLEDLHDPLISLMLVQRSGDQATYEMIGGLKEQIRAIREVVELPIAHPELFSAVGIEQPKGVLLYGPPGTGKTLLARAVAHHSNCAFFRLSGTELVQKYIGDGARIVRELFLMARQRAPAIIFLDEVDSIGGQRSDDSPCNCEQTMAELLNQVDGFEPEQNIKIVLATNRIDTLDQALLRPGRVDRKIFFPAPGLQARVDILRVHSSKMNLARGVDLNQIAEHMHGASGAELKLLCQEAAFAALREGRMFVQHDDFMERIGKVMHSLVKADPSSHLFK